MVATVGELASIYERDIATTFKPSYARATLSLSKIYIVPSLGKYKLEEVTGRAPQLMINFMRDKNLSRKTIKNAMTLLSAMVCTAKSWGYVATKLDWDTLFVPVEDVEKEVRCFTLDEAHRIIDAAPPKWKVCFALMAYLGLRTEETLALTWTYLDFGNAVPLVRQSSWYGRIQTVKSKGSRRDLPIPPALIDLLQEYRKNWVPNDQGFLFANKKGSSIGGQCLRRKILHPIRERLGIPRGAFHALRHDHATTMFSEGYPQSE
jgi:integrase